MRLSNTMSLNKILKFIKYFVVGGFAALVNITIFFIFAKLLQMNYFVVGALAFIIATLINYALSVRYVFKSGVRFSKKHELLWTYVISVIGLVGNEIILYLLINLLHIEIMASQVIAIGAVFLWNYIARNSFVFKDIKGGTE